MGQVRDSGSLQSQVSGVEKDWNLENILEVEPRERASGLTKMYQDCDYWGKT